MSPCRATANSVQLHYGRDDFADDARLARVLSRERAKDMASDYARDDRAPDRPRTERTPEPQAAAERSIFTGFRPKAMAKEPMVPASSDRPA